MRNEQAIKFAKEGEKNYKKKTLKLSIKLQQEFIKDLKENNESKQMLVDLLMGEIEHNLDITEKEISNIKSPMELTLIVKTKNIKKLDKCRNSFKKCNNIREKFYPFCQECLDNYKLK